MPSILKLTSLAALLGATTSAPAAKNTHDEVRRLEERLAALADSIDTPALHNVPADSIAIATPLEQPPHEKRQTHGAEGDLFTNEGGYLGGPAVNEPDQGVIGSAPWPLYVAEGAVTGAKYSTAGVETAGDFLTGGFLQPSNPVANTVGRFGALASDTAADYVNLAQGGTINPFAEKKEEQTDEEQNEEHDGQRRTMQAKAQPTPTFGEALGLVGESFSNDASETIDAINPFAHEQTHDRAIITVSASSDGCGSTHDDSALIRPFFVDSQVSIAHVY